MFFLIVEIYPLQFIAVFVAGEIKQDISSIYNSNGNLDKHKLSDIIKNKIIEGREEESFSNFNIKVIMTLTLSRLYLNV